MEYLSAIHICTVRKPVKIIKRFLSNESFEIVRYVFGLYGGVFHDGIINDLFTCVIGVSRSKKKSDGRVQKSAVIFKESVKIYS